MMSDTVINLPVATNTKEILTCTIPSDRPLTLKEEDCRPDDSAAVIVVKNLEHVMAQKALERFLSDVFEETLNLESLLQKMHCSSQTIASLKNLSFAPLCRNLTLTLKEKLTQTKEGERLFELAESLYGLFGKEALPVSKIAVKLKLTHMECKRSIIRLKARLCADYVRHIVQDLLQSQIESYEKSALAQVMAMAQKDQEGTRSNKLDLEEWLRGKLTEVARLLETQAAVNIECSGSSKTSLAVAIAARLAEKGQSVLYVCHSRLLASFVREQIDSLNLPINTITFHALCHASAMAAGLKVPRFVSERVFTELFPELLIEAMHLRPELRFDVVVVDEGHALSNNMRRALRACLKDREVGSFLFFYDGKLLGFNRKATVPNACQISLSEELPISERSNALDLYEVLSEKEKHETVSMLVEKLICDDGFCPRDIAILSSRSRGRLRFNLPPEIRIAGKPRADQSKSTLVATSIFKFRALTAPVVILIDLDEEVEEMTAWKLKYFSYLAYGRAREKLILVGSQAAMCKLLPPNAQTIATADLAQ
jgi:hypothetical protein